MKLKIKPYYKDFLLKNYTKKAPHETTGIMKDSKVEYIELDYGKDE